MTGLDFGELRDYDPMANTQEGYDAVTGIEVEGPEDIKFLDGITIFKFFYRVRDCM